MKKSINIPVLFIGMLVFTFLLFYPIFKNQPAQQAFALFVLVAILWMTEAIPLALTGIMIPVVAILLKLVHPKEAFSQFAHPVIFLFLGGFVLAGALTTHAVDKLLAVKLIKLANGNFYRSSILMMLSTSLLAFLDQQYVLYGYDAATGTWYAGTGEKRCCNIGSKIPNARHSLFRQYRWYSYNGK
jgi:sodium-dependent dicarboxylate transporter 2/3/5